jgi:hypothetical protein
MVPDSMRPGSFAISSWCRMKDERPRTDGGGAAASPVPLASSASSVSNLSPGLSRVARAARRSAPCYLVIPPSAAGPGGSPDARRASEREGRPVERVDTTARASARGRRMGGRGDGGGCESRCERHPRCRGRPLTARCPAISLSADEAARRSNHATMIECMLSSTQCTRTGVLSSGSRTTS